MPAAAPGYPYVSTLPWEPPQEKDYLRGDFWGIEVPGAPWIPGMAQAHYDRLLSWFVERYADNIQRAYYSQVAGFGYTHTLLSADDSMGPVDNGPYSPPGFGRTLQQFVRSCGVAKTWVPYVKVMLGSKYFSPKNMSFEDYKAKFEPIIDALLDAGVVDEINPFWEGDYWLTPGADTINILRWVGQKCRPRGVSVWAHFSPHVTAWFKDGDPRGRLGFWQDLAGDINGIDYQSQGAYWSAGMYQARAVDTLWQFGTDLRPLLYKFRGMEDNAIWMFANDFVDAQVDDQKNPDGSPLITHGIDVRPEATNARGYLICCTVDNVRHSDARVWGLGNGGRRPDGSRL